ncbi:MAG: long-chain fatty acid--CoA ligase [Actinomycetes bacterium]
MTDQAVLKERAEIDALVEGKTIVDLLDRNAEQYGGQPAIHWKDGDGWASLTWAEYREQIHQVAAGLQTLGVGDGEFVAIQASNRPEHVIADFGVVHAGATPVTIYSTLVSSQVQYIADNCKVTVAILEDLEFMKRWEEIRSDLPNLRYVVLMEGAENYDTLDWVLSWDDLMLRGASRLASDPKTVERSARAVTPGNLATLIYTSGTTGTPKGVMITQRNVMWTLESMVRAADLKPGFRMVSYLPLAHIAERIATHYLGTYLAGQVWYCPNLSNVLEYIQAARPNLFVGVPRVYEKFAARLHARFEEMTGVKKKLLDRALELNEKRVLAEERGKKGPAMAGLLDKIVLSKVRDQLGMDQLEIAITSAAPISPDLVKFFLTLGVPLFEIYGMSENTGPATACLPGAFRIGSVGKPLPGVEAKIGEDGELAIKGGIVAAGYYKLPEQTAETFGEDGWLYTGDLARIDEDGFIWIVGRKKDIIITAAGKNVAPAHMETMLGNHPLISKAAMVGDGKKFLTMIIALDAEEAPAWAAAHGIEYTDLASFSRHPKVHEEIAAAIEAANATVSRVEQIKKWYIVPDEWGPDTGELTPSLKLRRNVVLEKYANEIDAMYTGV